MSNEKQSRPKRWGDAANRAVSALHDLYDVQQEYQDWFDGLPENLQNGAMGDKLQSILDIDVQSALDAAEEAENADLPLGFGRD